MKVHIVDGRGPRLMLAMHIFQRHCFFCNSGSIFIGLFNGTLFVFVMSLVGQRERFLP